MFYKTAEFQTKIIPITRSNTVQLQKTAALHWTDVNAFPDRYSSLISNYITANRVRVGEYNPEFKYYRVIALHGDKMNDNGDWWHYGDPNDSTQPELLRYDESLGKQVFSTFNGRGSFKNHENDDVTKAVGLVLDTVATHEGKYIEALLAVDSIKDPELVRGIDMGYINNVSMGCLCAYSICSICEHKAFNEAEYCDHIKFQKSQTIYHKGEYKQVYEDNRGVNFIELSWVDVPADRDAKLLEKVANNIVLSEDGGIMYDAVMQTLSDAQFLCPNDYAKLLKVINYNTAKKIEEIK